MTEIAQVPQLTSNELDVQVGSERAQVASNLDKETVKLTLTGDGTVVTKSEAQTLLAAGQDASHPYENGRRA